MLGPRAVARRPRPLVLWRAQVLATSPRRGTPLAAVALSPQCLPRSPQDPSIVLSPLALLCLSAGQQRELRCLTVVDHLTLRPPCPGRSVDQRYGDARSG